MIDFADLAIRTDYSSVDKATSALDRLTVAGGRSEGAARSMGGAWEQVGRQIRAASQTDADYFGARLAATHTRAASAAEGHAFSTGKVSRALESMIVHATGANHQLSQLSVAMADFGYGSALVTGVLAGLAAIALAYELITKNARDAHKAQDDAIKFLTDRFKPETGKGSAVNDAFDLARERQREDSRKLDILRNNQNDFAVAAAYRTAGFQAPFQSRDNEMVRVTKDLAEANRAVALAIAHGAGNLPSVGVTSDIHQRTAKAEQARLAAERERGAEMAIEAEVQNQRRDDMAAARRLNLVPQSSLSPIPITGQLSAAEQKHMESVIKLDEAYKAAIGPFKSVHAALDDFKMGLKEAATGLLEQFSPANLAQNLVGGIASQVQGFISGIFSSAIGGLRHAIFGQSGQERDAQRQAEASARALALQIDAVTKALGGDQLGAAINALQIGLISTLQSINDALPGTRNEAERNRLRAEATAQEQQQEARARHQDELNRRYAEEDLAVRNLRALGQGDAADRLAFQEQQQREMQKAIDEGRDATYLNTLATVQNNEWLAFLNGTLQDAIRNSPQGFRIDPYLYAYQTPRGSSPADPFGTGMLPPNFPKPDKPGGSTGGVLNISIENITVDGSKSADEVVNTLVDRLDQAAAATGGRGSSRTTALELLKRRG